MMRKISNYKKSSTKRECEQRQIAITTMEFRRKLYPRGGSYETTIPKPLLFSIEDGKKYEVVFSYNSDDGSWSIRLEEQE